MKTLLRTDLLKFYGLGRQVLPEVIFEQTSDETFDMQDAENSIFVSYRSGNVSFQNSNHRLYEAVKYESFINALSGTAFERGRKRCDLILYDVAVATGHFFLLNEETSTLESTFNLCKPILNKKGDVQFNGGKYEKVEKQLEGSLETLLAVPSIARFINKYLRKVCLMSYVINRRTEDVVSARRTFSRYRMVEAKETGENGALLDCPPINNLGFEYRRISHDYVFNLD